MAAVTDAERELIRALHAQGLGRNAIALEVGRSAGTISTIVKQLGLSFDRSKTAAATEARQIDNRARRTALIGRAYARAEKIYDRLEADTYRFTASTVAGIETADLDHVPAQDEKALAGAAGSHLSHAVKLEQVDADNGAGESTSMLDALAAGLGAAYEQLKNRTANDAGD